MEPVLRNISFFERVKITDGQNEGEKSFALFEPILFAIFHEFPSEYKMAICFSIDQLVKGQVYRVHVELLSPTGVCIHQDWVAVEAVEDHPKIPACLIGVTELESVILTEEGRYDFLVYLDGVLLGSQGFLIYKEESDGTSTSQ